MDRSPGEIFARIDPVLAPPQKSVDWLVQPFGSSTYNVLAPPQIGGLVGLALLSGYLVCLSTTAKIGGLIASFWMKCTTSYLSTTKKSVDWLGPELSPIPASRLSTTAKLGGLVEITINDLKELGIGAYLLPKRTNLQSPGLSMGNIF